MDGEEITLEDAKQVKLSKPVLTTILPFLKNEVASTAQEVMTALNNYAAAQAKTIKLQGEAKLGGRALLTAQRKAASKKKAKGKKSTEGIFTAKGATTDGGTVNESNTESAPDGRQTRVASPVGAAHAGENSQNDSRGAKSVGSQTTGVSGHGHNDTGRKTGESGVIWSPTRDGSSILEDHPGAPGFVVPEAELGDFIRYIKSCAGALGIKYKQPGWWSLSDLKLEDEMTRLTKDGAGRVVFFFAPGLDAGAVRYDTATGQYVVEINLAAMANPHKTASHESIHLWLKALNEERRHTYVSQLAREIFGDNYQEAFDTVVKVYKGKYTDEALINEEMVAYAYGGWGELVGTNFSFKKYRSARRRGKPEEAGHGAKLREEAD